MSWGRKVAFQSGLVVAFLSALLAAWAIFTQQFWWVVVATVVADYRPPEGRAAPVLTPAAEPLLVRADHHKLQQAVLNILSNAYKYSPDGGAVTLRVKPVQATKLLIEVSDQGIGIPPADQPNLFESFHRASNVGNIAGTGLGLSIVRDAVECHRGTISLHSAAGQGSCFTVMLEAPPADTGNT